MKLERKGGVLEGLKQWLADNPNPVHPHIAIRCHLAQKLIEDQDMTRAWPELEKRGIGALPFLSLVQNSFESARKEIKRQPVSEVSSQLATVDRLIGELREAIEQSPLPPNMGWPYEISHSTLPSLNVLIGWRDMAGCDFFGVHTQSIVEMLDIASELVGNFRKNQPPRTVIRHTKRPEITAFVRWLGWRVNHEYGFELPGTLARVANAVYEPTQPLDKEDVKGILRTASPPFAKKKGGSKRAGNLP